MEVLANDIVIIIYIFINTYSIHMLVFLGSISVWWLTESQYRESDFRVVDIFFFKNVSKRICSILWLFVESVAFSIWCFKMLRTTQWIKTHCLVSDIVSTLGSKSFFTLLKFSIFFNTKYLISRQQTTLSR